MQCFNIEDWVAQRQHSGYVTTTAPRRKYYCVYSNWVACGALGLLLASFSLLAQLCLVTRSSGNVTTVNATVTQVLLLLLLCLFKSVSLPLLLTVVL